MISFFTSLLWFIVALGILVSLHELGHYAVARLFGVHVTRFSFGFGKALLSRTDKHGTAWVIAPIPLGGYVKFLSQHEPHPFASQYPQRIYESKPAWQRLLIVLAGPLANLLLAVLLLWLMFVVGRPDYQALIGQAQGIAAAAGLQQGDRITQLGQREIHTWSEFVTGLGIAAIEGEDIAITVQRADSSAHTVQLPISQLQQHDNLAHISTELGLTPHYLMVAPVVGAVQADAAAAGLLQPGDTITAINAQPVRYFQQISPLLQQAQQRAHATHDAHAAHAGVTVTVLRDGTQHTLPIAMPAAAQNGQEAPPWRLGIFPQTATLPQHDALQRYPVLTAAPYAISETKRLLQDNLTAIAGLFTGRAALDNIAGPLTIARYANASASRGFAWFLTFLALLSLGLFIINMLPIPILDGGQALYYLIEMAQGRPLSEKAMAIGQHIGLAAVAGMMALAFYNDFLKLLQ